MKIFLIILKFVSIFMILNSWNFVKYSSSSVVSAIISLLAIFGLVRGIGTLILSIIATLQPPKVSIEFLWSYIDSLLLTQVVNTFIDSVIMGFIFATYKCSSSLLDMFISIIIYDIATTSLYGIGFTAKPHKK